MKLVDAPDGQPVRLELGVLPTIVVVWHGDILRWFGGLTHLTAVSMLDRAWLQTDLWEPVVQS